MCMNNLIRAEKALTEREIALEEQLEEESEENGNKPKTRK